MGKQGKPQKSRKHKKLKKTFDSGNVRDLVIGNKRDRLHNLPVNDDDVDRQDIPSKARKLMQRKDVPGNNKAKMKKEKKKKLKTAAEQSEMETGMTRPMKVVPDFVKEKKESSGAFMRRVERETQQVLMTAKMEQKYKVDLTNGPSNKIVKKPPTERKREKDREKKKKKNMSKQMKKLDKTMDFASLRDDVAFGDVVMAPPSLTAKPRKANLDDDTARPGKRSLLLKSMFDNPAGSSTDTSEQDNANKLIANAKTVAQRQLGQTVKRKYLSPAQRQITDFQRQKAIDLYRNMRDKKYAMNNLKT